MRPILEKSTMLAALVETLVTTRLQAAPAGYWYAGPEDVACDVCTGRKLRALKSCLDCQVSYCDTHLQPHHDVAPLQKHKLVEPTKNLQENVCPRHDEVMRLFCRTDQQRICSLCSVNEHQGHHIVAAETEWTERQRELEKTRLEIQQRIQHTEEEVRVLQKSLKAINDTADKAIKDREKLFTEMIHLMEKQRSEVEQQVRSTKEAKVIQIKNLQKKLEQEITELKSRDVELEKILHTWDHNQFLHNFSSLLTLGKSPELSRHLQSENLRHFEEGTASVSMVRDKIQEILTEALTNVSWTVSNVEVLLSKAEPRSREDFLGHSRQINFDPNTTNKRLVLTEGNRKVIHLGKDQPYRDHPDRFTYWPQIMSKDCLTGRCYWEVEWEGWIGVAVAYKNIRRAGGSIECEFGLNDKSWSLFCSSGIYRFYHNKIRNDVSGPKSSRVGVYLDYSEGLLCFYSISQNMELLYKVQTTFTQPLYAGLLIGVDSLAKLVA